MDDLGATPKSIRPQKLYNSFEVEWEKETKKEPKKRSVLKALLRSNGICYWGTAILLNLIGIVLHFIPTMVLSVFVEAVEQESDSKASLNNQCVDDLQFWMYALILLIAPILLALTASACQIMLVRVGVSMKSMVSEAIYRKALRLSSVAKGSTSTGQLVNIMSSDTYSLMSFTMSVCVIISMPVMVLDS